MGFQRQRQRELCEFKTSLVYIVKLRATERDPASKTKHHNKTIKTELLCGPEIREQPWAREPL